MDGGKPQQQPEEEAVHDAAAEVAEEDGANQLDLDLDAMATDEALAHALHMEELMQVEDWDWNMRRLEVPRAVGAQGPADVVHPAPAGQAFVDHHQFIGPLIFDDADAAAAEDNANQVAVAHPAVGVADPRYVPPQDQLAAPANADNQLAAQATNNLQHADTARGGDRPPAPQRLIGGNGGALTTVPHSSRASNQTSRRNGQPVEAMTIRLETRSRADAVISARQAMLGDANSSRVVLAGMDEEEYGNSWYDSVVREAGRMELMEEPGLCEDYEVSYSFQTQLLPSSQQEQQPCYNYDYDSSTEQGLGGLHLHPSEFDPDKPGPSTVRVRVPPLADDELPKFTCGICLETLPILDLFHGMQCAHRFCAECMATYIEGRVHAGEVPVPCPDPACREGATSSRDLHPEECKKSIDFAAFSSWGDRLTESAVPPSLRAYCPNRRCGVMLEAAGGKTPAKAYCPACGHPMCATCGLEWSRDDSGQHDCTEGPSAELVKKLAEDRRWKQCPKCKMIVEKIDGCNVMRCRCKFVFCYNCGLPMGRQMGMEEGAELCQCQNTVHAAQVHAQWFQHQ